MFNRFFKAITITASLAAWGFSANITSMTATQGPNFTVGEGGDQGFTFPVFNATPQKPAGDHFDDVKDDFAAYVSFDNSNWVLLFDNPASGFIYDQNFGYFWYDPGEGKWGGKWDGGLWFGVDKTTYIKLQSKANGSVNLVYTLTFNYPPRQGNNLSVFEGNGTLTADGDGNLGFVFPRVGGTPSKQADWDKFTIQIQINGQWVALDNPVLSTFYYSSNGYNTVSPNNQYAQWWDAGLSGLWFRPVMQNYQVRVGYPANGQTGGAIGDNWLVYNLIGNPAAQRPDGSDLVDIALSTPDNPAISGWNLIFQDEFNGNALDDSKWTMDYGFCLNDDPGTCGWGNNEAQWYSQDAKNVFVEGGFLNLRAISNDPRTFQGQTAQYSSGKVHSRDKFKFTYGRIDFRVKLPAVSGTWPATWMMPNDDYYGGWASSGELDVMEAKGRLSGQSSGAIHFGSAWPGNTYIGGEYHFPNGGGIDQFNVYSVVWEQSIIKWYVNGKCFNAAKNTQWHSNPSTGVTTNDYSPFDKDFFIIMNLATGGWFDPQAWLNPADFPATMQVDYVRVYKPSGSTQINSNAANAKMKVSFAGIRNGQINLRLSEGAHSVELYDLKGRLIDKIDFSAVSGLNATGLRTDKLSKGVFILNVKKNGVSILQRKITTSK